MTFVNVWQEKKWHGIEQVLPYHFVQVEECPVRINLFRVGV